MGVSWNWGTPLFQKTTIYMHFEKLLKATPLVGLSTPNNVHVHPQFQNTLSSPEQTLISIEILTYPLDLQRNINWK